MRQDEATARKREIALASSRTTRVKLVCEPSAFAAHTANIRPHSPAVAAHAASQAAAASQISATAMVPDRDAPTAAISVMLELTPRLRRFSESVQVRVVDDVRKRVRRVLGLASPSGTFPTNWIPLVTIAKEEKWG